MYIFFFRARTWSVVQIKGVAPRARVGHSATLVGSKLFLFGGYTGSEYLNDVFAYDLETVKKKNLYTYVTLKENEFFCGLFL